VQVRVERAARVVLWWAPSQSEPFQAVAMRDGGAGVFSATTPTVADGDRVHVYVEAVSDDGSAVTLAPAGGSGRPRTVLLAPR
jgi:hypothetical protein